jgi:Flp pilus assembly protein TadG
MPTDVIHSELTRTRRQGRRGATIIEFALFFMLFLVLAVGLMEFARGVWTYTTVSHAARAGARYAVVHGASNPIANGETSIADYVKQNAVGLAPSDLTVAATYDTTNEKGNIVQISVSYPFRFATGLLVSQSTINMGTTTRMVIMN